MGAVVLLALSRSKDENLKKNLCFWTSLHYVRARPAGLYTLPACPCVLPRRGARRRTGSTATDVRSSARWPHHRARALSLFV